MLGFIILSGNRHGWPFLLCFLQRLGVLFELFVLNWPFGSEGQFVLLCYTASLYVQGVNR
ncbi:MAG: hypothetical protein JST28_10030 [Acidobacteria bacterium]|nr:hypothetical protein [Acidobacteriota bacterium]